MRKLIFILVITSLTNSVSAWACAGFPAGVEKEPLVISLGKIEKQLSQDESLGRFSNLRFYWADINANRGIEGDCQAITIIAAVNISAEGEKGQQCAFPAKVEFVDTEVIFSQHFQAQIDEPFCF